MGEEEEHGHTGWKVRNQHLCALFIRLILTIDIRDQAYLESLVAEVEQNVNGKRVMVEGEDDSGDEDDNIKNDKDA